MIPTLEFFESVFDSLTEHIAVIDENGVIRYVNQSWNKFGYENSGTLSDGWEGADYLNACHKSAESGDEVASIAAEGIRKIINKESNSFYLEYSCHSPDERRWFLMIVTPFESKGSRYFVLSHQNITERKLAEEKLLKLSRIDSLTGLHNRGYFDEHLIEEWKRATRLSVPLTLALIDLDHFKILNDTYGHTAGDECLSRLGETIKASVKRPGDICARYGGEEFVILLTNTTIDKSLQLFIELLDEIRGLNIPNENSPTKPIVTASIGLGMVYPDDQMDPKQLINMADRNLYLAKNNGRDQVIHQELK